MKPPRFRIVALGALCMAISCTPPDRGRSERILSSYLDLLAAEDARPGPGEAGRAALLDGARSATPFLRQSAVRALGRLEDPALVDVLFESLQDPVEDVRAEAANALGQAVHRTDGDVIVERLIEHLDHEEDAAVIAATARTLGRSAASDETRRQVSQVLVDLSRGEDGDAPEQVVLGVALGLESMVRKSGGQGMDGAAAARLLELTTYGLYGQVSVNSPRIRALAVQTLGTARRLTLPILDDVRADRDWPVRLAGARFIGSAQTFEQPELARRNLADGDPHLSLAAIQFMATQAPSELFCRYFLAASLPEVPPMIRVPAINGLARPCPQGTDQRALLLETASAIDTVGYSEWHAAAAALNALARVRQSDARALLPRFAGHANPFVRVEAARAARAVGDITTLANLLADTDANVEEVSLEGLYQLMGREADDFGLNALESDAPQVLMRAADSLEGTERRDEATAALLAAFERVSAKQQPDEYDARAAILTRLAETADSTSAARLMPYLADYEARIAERVAGLLTEWTGTAHEAAPQPLPQLPLPTEIELARLVNSAVVLHMLGGGQIVIALHPFTATTNVTRFARLVEDGSFDGTTFHRHAPNFVIQGGGPGANEYVGHGAYSRDELGLQGHWRGTVGISTRGRDTADAQIFVNLVDNVRLNHDYTIVGTVVEGMDVVDAVMPGALIERAELRRIQ